jgi:hypothetical protein
MDGESVDGVAWFCLDSIPWEWLADA